MESRFVAKPPHALQLCLATAMWRWPSTARGERRLAETPGDHALVSGERSAIRGVGTPSVTCSWRCAVSSRSHARTGVILLVGSAIPAAYDACESGGGGDGIDIRPTSLEMGSLVQPQVTISRSRGADRVAVPAWVSPMPVPAMQLPQAPTQNKRMTHDPCPSNSSPTNLAWVTREPTFVKTGHSASTSTATVGSGS